VDAEKLSTKHEREEDTKELAIDQPAKNQRVIKTETTPKLETEKKEKEAEKKEKKSRKKKYLHNYSECLFLTNGMPVCIRYGFSQNYV